MAERDLWLAVVACAAEDLRTQSYRSVDYNAAEAFFFGAGPWARSRQRIADQIDMHADDLTQLARTVLARRAQFEGAPPADYTPPVVRAPSPKPVRTPRPTKPRVTLDRNGWIARFMAKQAA